MTDYSPKYYIGVRVGRRVWAPLWPRKDGAAVYLPDPDQSRTEESPAFAHFRDRLAERGYALTWTVTYNAGANPVELRLPRSDLADVEIQSLLRATYVAVLPGAVAWSEVHSPQEEVWPDREHNPHVLRSRLSEARIALVGGIGRDGRRIVLDESVGCDWQRFLALAAGDEADWRAALALVRGRPFDGYDAEWLHVEGHLATIEAAVVDLALDVAKRELAAGDAEAAAAAAAAGLRTCPYDERLYQVAMKAAAERGATGEVKALRRQLDRILEDDVEPDDHLDPPTVEAYEEALPAARRATG